MIKLADGKERLIQHLKATHFVGPNGKLLSVAQFVQLLYNTLVLPDFVKHKDQLRSIWSASATRKQLLHKLADAVASAVDIPDIHIIDETARCLVDAGCRKPLLIATRYTMEQGLYQQRMSRHGIDVLVPSEADRNATHASILAALERAEQRLISLA